MWLAEAVEVDERWSYVAKPPEQQWLGHAIDHRRGKVLAYVFGRRKDEVCLKLKTLLEPFGLTRYETDYGGLTHVILVGMSSRRANAIPEN